MVAIVQGFDNIILVFYSEPLSFNAEVVGCRERRNSGYSASASGNECS